MGICEINTAEDLSLPQLQLLARAHELADLDAESRETLVKRLDSCIIGMVQREELALPVMCWDPDSSNQQEKNACMRLGTVFVLYEPQYWWWEIVETLRKLVLISVLTVVNADAASYLWMAFLVSFLSLVCHGGCKPYSEPSLDKMQACSLVVTCLTIFYGIMLTHQRVGTADSNERSFEGILLASIQILVVTLPLGTFWMERRSTVIQHLRAAARVATRVAAKNPHGPYNTEPEEECTSEHPAKNNVILV